MRYLKFMLVLALIGGISLPLYALEIQEYTPENLKAAVDSNKKFGLQFHAEWCPTCHAQEKAFGSFMNDPAINKELDLLILVADYDEEHALKRQFNVRQQSLIILVEGNRELKRFAGISDQDSLLLLLSE